MIDFQAFRLAIIDWVSAATDLPNDKMVWEDQSESRPPRPYVSLKLINPGQRKGHDVLIPAESSGYHNAGLREFMLSVNLYGAESFEKSYMAMSGIEDPLVLEEFKSKGIAYIACSQLRDLTRSVAGRYESRHQFDVRFRLADNMAVDPGTIEKVEITDEINGNVINVEKP